MGAFAPPELQWVGTVDSVFFFFLGMGFSRGWSWRSVVWRSEAVGGGGRSMQQRPWTCSKEPDYMVTSGRNAVDVVLLILGTNEKNDLILCL